MAELLFTTPEEASLMLVPRTDHPPTATMVRRPAHVAATVSVLEVRVVSPGMGLQWT